MLQEVAIAAERFVGIEPGIIERIVETKRKARHRVLPMLLIRLYDADRADRAGDHRLIRPVDLRFADGLVKNRRGVLTLLKRLRRQLSARVTVDAGRVDKEVPVNIGWEFLFKI